MDVDAAFRSANQENEELIANLQECRANLQTVYNDNYNRDRNSSDYWRAVAYSSKPDRAAESAIELTATAMCPDSPRSDLSGRFSGNLSYDGGSCDGGSVGGIGGGGGGGGARGRAVGKRNQEIYLPDGVKLSHITEKCNSGGGGGGGGGDCGGDVAQSEWIGNYNALTNMIVRTIDAAPAPAAPASDEVAQTQQVVVAYETLKHFAQEHDREICGTNYFPEFTTNVWTNQNFKFYNTVSCAWEPLGSLRT